jgi:LysM repeat protein
MKRTLNILLIIGCVVLIAAVAFVTSVKSAGTTAASVPQVEQSVSIALPPLDTNSLVKPLGGGIARRMLLKTILPKRPDDKITEYVVQNGDSPWSIAQKFSLKPETILWANDSLNASAGSLKASDTLKILPVNGVLHTVQDGDTLETLQTLHGTPAQEIFEYTGNNFDLTQPPKLTKGQQIIIPNGIGPISWSEAQAPGAALAPNSRYSGKVPNLGTGYFIWPVNTHYLTQEFWSGHAGIDINTDFRQPVFAADSGTVTFSGWDTTGYGNMVIIDHGNGYKTYYSHNEALLISTGQTVVKGQQISESGSTGNSTGNHLDFRIIYNGSFVNPMNFLP